MTNKPCLPGTTSLPTSQDHAAPQPIPPFSPRTPKRNTKQYNTSSPSQPLTIANGCNLLVCGAGADKRGSNAVLIVQQAAAKLRRDDPKLVNIPILVKAFKPGSTDWSTSCYVHLDVATMGRSSEPRADLLELWKDALTKFNEDWEVVWTPTKHGSDKRMWIRFLDLPSIPGDDDKFSKVTNIITSWANACRFTITSSYVFKGALVATLASPKQADALATQGTVSIPGIPTSLSVARGNQIEVLNAFKLVITGLSDDYEGLDLSIEAWLETNIMENDETTFVSSQTDPHVSNCFVFHMTTWAATTKVLDDAMIDKFKTTFQSFGDPSPPQLITKANTNGIYKKPGNLRLDFARGSSTLNTTLKSFEKRLMSLEDNTNQRFDASDQKIDGMNNAIGHLQQSIVSLDQNLAYTKASIIAHASTTDVDRAIMELHTQQNQLKFCLLMESSDDKRKAFNARLVELQHQETGLLEKQKNTRTSFSAIMTNQPTQTLITSPALPQNPSSPLPPPGLLIDGYTSSGEASGRKRPRLVKESSAVSQPCATKPRTLSDTSGDISVCPSFASLSNTLITTNDIPIDVLSVDNIKPLPLWKGRF